MITRIESLADASNEDVSTTFRMLTAMKKTAEDRRAQWKETSSRPQPVENTNNYFSQLFTAVNEEMIKRNLQNDT